MRLYHAIILLCWSVTAGASISCYGNGTNETEANAADMPLLSVTDSIETLPLPHVPTTLREPTARANYIISHFWDAMDFGDTSRSHNRNFMEQNFSNYISVFPYAADTVRTEAVAVLMAKAEANKEAYQLLADIADHYLYDPDSPMYNEDYYILFAEQMVHSPLMKEAEQSRMTRRLEMAQKNRPNTKATDFSFLTRQGKRSTLHKTRPDNLLLLVFYDPDCTHCQEVMSEMQRSPLLTVKVKERDVTVLAVYADGDKELWEKTADSLPDNWTVAFGSDDIEEKGLYSLRAMPTLYLLDRNHQVILKDPPLPALLDYLRKE